MGFKTPLPKKAVPTNRSPPSDASFVTAAKKHSAVKSNNNNSKTAMFHNLDHKKPTSWKNEIDIPQETAYGDDITRRGSVLFESRDDENDRNSRPETKRVLFSSIRDDKLHKFGSLRCGSKVVPYHDDENCYDKDVEVSNPIEELYENQKDMEDLSLIREQLMQIESQQSSLLDLLQVQCQSLIFAFPTLIIGMLICCCCWSPCAFMVLSGQLS